MFYAIEEHSIKYPKWTKKEDEYECHNGTSMHDYETYYLNKHESWPK